MKLIRWDNNVAMFCTQESKQSKTYHFVCHKDAAWVVVDDDGMATKWLCDGCRARAGFAMPHYAAIARRDDPDTAQKVGTCT